MFARRAKENTANCDIYHFTLFFVVLHRYIITRRSTTGFCRSFHVDLTISPFCFRNTSAKDRRCETACPSAWRKVSTTFLARIARDEIFCSRKKKKKKGKRYNLFSRSRFTCFSRGICDTKSIRPLVNSLAPLGRPMARYFVATRLHRRNLQWIKRRVLKNL